MTRRLASGAASAAALAKSRTIEALVLNRSVLDMSLLLLKIVRFLHTITGHARLSRNTSWDEDYLRTGQGFS